MGRLVFSLHAVLIIHASLWVLLGTIATPQECSYQQRICECDPAQTECHFTMVVEKMASLTSYKLTRAESGTFIDVVNAPSTGYFFDTAGRLRPRDNASEDPSVCSVYNEHFLQNDCSIPMTIDSTMKALIKTINGLMPGPTLVVSHNQTVVIDVTNNLFGEGLSIHWHGIHQNSTPWMDGVEHITQCPIPAYTTFRYMFKAMPSGTMWYHSHTGTQRIEGIFGSLVVREPADLMEKAERKLQEMIGEEFEILDKPQYTMSLIDWVMTAADVTLIIFTGYRDPPPPAASGLINGIGRELDVPYVRSRLSIFNVQYREETNPFYYRFRLVGAENYYIYTFSIAEHKLIVISTDGQLTEPIEVDYISVNSGERYDFLLKPKTEAEANGRSNFLISVVAMLEPIENIAEGILHYGTEEDQPLSTEYEEIITSIAARNCSEDSYCTNLNCPFSEYPAGIFIRCIPITQMQLLFETEDQVPSNNIEYQNEYFFDASLQEPLGRGSINGRFFVSPSGSLLTHPHDVMDQDNMCQLGLINCSAADISQCVCTHVVPLDSPFATVQFILTSIGDGVADLRHHPMHLHGHSFQVVGIFFGTYDSSGNLVVKNPSVTCNSDPRCTNPSWTALRVDGDEVTSKTIRKDTITVPAGGYVVVRFIADNPGYWYMHCHTEAHLVEGMNVVINELNDLHNPPPEQLALQQCGNFNISVDELTASG